METHSAGSSVRPGYPHHHRRAEPQPACARRSISRPRVRGAPVWRRAILRAGGWLSPSVYCTALKPLQRGGNHGYQQKSCRPPVDVGQDLALSADFPVLDGLSAFSHFLRAARSQIPHCKVGEELLSVEEHQPCPPQAENAESVPTLPKPDCALRRERDPPGGARTVQTFRRPRHAC